MTAIGSILKSYVNPRRLVFWSLVLYVVNIPTCFAILTAAAREAEKMSFPALLNSLFFPLFSYGFSILAVGTQLRQMLLEGEEADMLPRYHERQLTAAGIIMAPCLLVFFALTFFFGWTPLPALAGFLGITAVTLWFGTNFLGGFMILFLAPLNITAIFFPDESISVVLAESFLTLWAGVGAHANALSGFLIVLSLGGIVLFCVRYLKIPCAVARNHGFFTIGFGYIQHMKQTRHEAAFDLEYKNSRMNKIVENAAREKASGRRGQALSAFQLTRLIKFAMSRYNDAHGRNYGGDGFIRALSAIFGLLVMIIAFSRLIFDPLIVIAFMLPFTCGTITAMAASIFQSNKNQLPALYLQTDLPSKTAFMKTAAAGYLWSVAEPVLIFMGTALAAHVFFPSIAWRCVFQAALMTVALVLVQASIPLLTGNRRKTPPGPGWLFSLMMMYTPVYIILRFAASWIIAGIFIFAGTIIFCAALRRWTKSEMDCE